jgi:hypothetical protein
MAFSPLCQVKDGAGSWTATVNGVDVTPGNTISVQLTSTTDVSEWYLQVLGTDELLTAPALTGVSPVDNKVTTPSTVVTFTMPSGVGHALRFESRVTGSGGPLTTTFGIYSLTSHGRRVGASGEELEGDGTFGWSSILNPFLRSGAAVVYYNDAVALPTLGANNVQGVLDALKGTLGGRTLSLSAPATNNVLTWNGAQWEPAAATGGGFTAGGDLTGSSTSQLVSNILSMPTPAKDTAADQYVLKVEEFNPNFDSPGLAITDGTYLYAADATRMDATTWAEKVGKFLPIEGGSRLQEVAHVWMSDLLDVKQVVDIAQDDIYLYVACIHDTAPINTNIAILRKDTLAVAGYGSMGVSNDVISVCADNLGYFYGVTNLGGNVQKFNLAACLGAAPDTVTAVATYTSLNGTGSRIRYGGGYLWYSGKYLGVEKVDAATMSLVVAAPAILADPTLYAFGSLWAGVPSEAAGSWVRLNPTTLAVQATIPIGDTPVEITLGPNSAGVPNSLLYISDLTTYNVCTIDPSTDTITNTYAFPPGGVLSRVFAGVAAIGNIVYCMSPLANGSSVTGVFYIDPVLAVHQAVYWYMQLNYDPPFTPSGDLNGTFTNQVVQGLQGYYVYGTAPSTGQALVWNGFGWSPATAAVTLAGDVTGASGANTVVKLRNRTLATTAPTNGQVLTWNTASSWWVPATVTATVTLAGDVTGASGTTTVEKLRGRTVATTAPTSGQVLAWNSTSVAWTPTTGLPEAYFAGQLASWSGTAWEAKWPAAGLISVQCGSASLASGQLVKLTEDITNGGSGLMAYPLEASYGPSPETGLMPPQSGNIWRGDTLAPLYGVYEYDAAALDHFTGVIAFHEAGSLIVKHFQIYGSGSLERWYNSINVVETTIFTGANVSNVCVTRTDSTHFVVGYVNLTDGKGYVIGCTYRGFGTTDTFGTPVAVSADTDVCSLAVEKSYIAPTAASGAFMVAWGRSTPPNRGFIQVGALNTSTNAITLSGSSGSTFGDASCPAKCITLRNLQSSTAGSAVLFGILYGDKSRGVDILSSTGVRKFAGVDSYTNAVFRADATETLTAGFGQLLDGVTEAPGFGDFLAPDKFVNIFQGTATGYTGRTIINAGDVSWNLPVCRRPQILPQTTTSWDVRNFNVRALNSRMFAWTGLMTAPVADLGNSDPVVVVGTGTFTPDGGVCLSTGECLALTWDGALFVVPVATQQYWKTVIVPMAGGNRFAVIGSCDTYLGGSRKMSFLAAYGVSERDLPFGIMQEAATSGQSKRCVTVGGISRVHSGLTPGATYYKGTTAPSRAPVGPPIGIAISTTEIALIGTPRENYSTNP